MIHCKKCGSYVWDGAQRCPGCGTRAYDKDPFKGLTDDILLEEIKRRGLYTDSIDENLKLKKELEKYQDFVSGLKSKLKNLK